MGLSGLRVHGFRAQWSGFRAHKARSLGRGAWKRRQEHHESRAEQKHEDLAPE